MRYAHPTGLHQYGTTRPMRNGEGNSHHRSILQKLGFGQWSKYDLPAINQAFVERSPRHLKDATYNIAGLSIACHSGLYHPNVNSSSVFIFRHLLDKALFSNQPENILGNRHRMRSDHPCPATILEKRIVLYLEEQGLFLPFICTPDKLLGADDD